jgi:hypothetical protein
MLITGSETANRPGEASVPPSAPVPVGEAVDGHLDGVPPERRVRPTSSPTGLSSWI